MKKKKLAPGTLGVVPGKFGGFTFLSLDGVTIRSFPMPIQRSRNSFRIDIISLVASIRAIQAEFEILLILIEEVTVSLVHPATMTDLEMIRSVYDYGLVHGAIAPLGVPFDCLKPGSWMGVRYRSPYTLEVKTDEVDGISSVRKAVKINVRGIHRTVAQVARNVIDQEHELNKSLGLADFGRLWMKRGWPINSGAYENRRLGYMS